MEFNAAKLGELILYIADKSVDDPNFGLTKLNKILCFSDFGAYRLLGRPITGAVYQKLEYGPAARQFMPIKRELEASSAAATVPKMVREFTQKRLVALRQPDLSFFTADEISIVDDMLEVLGPHNAASVSKLSHEVMLGWQAAAMNEDIPYNTYFWRQPSAETLARGREVAHELGLPA